MITTKIKKDDLNSFKSFLEKENIAFRLRESKKNFKNIVLKEYNKEQLKNFILFIENFSYIEKNLIKNFLTSKEQELYFKNETKTETEKKVLIKAKHKINNIKLLGLILNKEL